jgi:dihydroorotase
MFDALIRGGSLVGPAGIEPKSLAINGGKISALLDPCAASEARETIDAEGMLILPGLVDAHVHFREPGLVHKEGFATGSRAAAAGGVTTVMVMPTDNPMTMTPEQFLEKKELATGACHVDFALQAGLGPDVGHVRALAELGAVSFEIFLADLAPPMLVSRMADLLACLRAVADVHSVAGITPGDDSITQTLSAAAQAKPKKERLDFPRSRPPIAEAISLAQACLAVAETGARAHIRQISCAQSVAVLRALAPKQLSSEVTPHNLLLEEQELERQGPVAKVAPPLRPAPDLQAVLGALRERIIHIVATDHAPHLPEEKRAGEADIWKAPGGFPGVQTLLPLMLRLVGDGALTYQDLVRCCCEAPARLFDLYPQKGTLEIGADADVVIVDPKRPFTIRNEDQESKARQTPFAGWTAPASPVLAMLRGKIIMRDGKPVGQPAGRFVSPRR